MPPFRHSVIPLCPISYSSFSVPSCAIRDLLWLLKTSAIKGEQCKGNNDNDGQTEKERERDRGEEVEGRKVRKNYAKVRAVHDS